MALTLHGEPSIDETVERVLEYALRAVGCDCAGVIFVHGGGRVETAAATHEVVAALDQLQVDCGEGPDLDAVSDRYSVVVSDTRRETRWPTWARRAADLGIRSMLSTRLYTSEATIGALNLYAESADAFDVDDRAVAHVLARHAAVALASARESRDLWRAIDARKLIGQAQGILMERYDLDADRAFAVLVRYSQHHNVKLREVAQRLVDTRRLPTSTGEAPEPGAAGDPA
jgi:GAF domain-containing protein